MEPTFLPSVAKIVKMYRKVCEDTLKTFPVEIVRVTCSYLVDIEMKDVWSLETESECVCVLDDEVILFSQQTNSSTLMGRELHSWKKRPELQQWRMRDTLRGFRQIDYNAYTLYEGSSLPLVCCENRNVFLKPQSILDWWIDQDSVYVRKKDGLYVVEKNADPSGKLIRTNFGYEDSGVNRWCVHKGLLITIKRIHRDLCQLRIWRNNDPSWNLESVCDVWLPQGDSFLEIAATSTSVFVVSNSKVIEYKIETS